MPKRSANFSRSDAFLSRMDAPRVGIIFDMRRAFPPRVGLELLENFESMADIAEVHDHDAAIALKEILWQFRDSVDLTAVERDAVVLATGSGLYQIFQDVYDVEVTEFFGIGVGRLTAAVASGDVDLATALAQVRAGDASSSNGGDQNDELALNSIDTGDLDIVLDFGPGNTVSTLLRERGTSSAIISSLDSTINPHEFIDRISERKLFSTAFYAERALGHVAGSRNHRLGRQGSKETKTIATEIKTLIAGGRLSTDVRKAASEDLRTEINDITRLWIAHDRVKGYSEQQITDSLARVEEVTLLPIRALYSNDSDDSADVTKRLAAAQVVQEESLDAH